VNAERMGLVESVVGRHLQVLGTHLQEQYAFIYDCLCEAVECKVEPMTLDKLQSRTSMYKNKTDRESMERQDTLEYKTLNHLTPSLSIGDCAGGHRIENRGKNRDVMVVPRWLRW